MQTILLATDLSPRSDRAFDRALLLAQEHGARLDVLHVVDDAVPAATAATLTADALTSITARAHDGGGTVSPMVRSGPVARTILDVAEETNADLIVMGVPREDSLREFFVGTTVERVIRRGRRPVLVVRDRARARYANVVVGIDFSVHARHAVEFTARLAPQAGTTLVHAYDVPFKHFLTGRSRDAPLSNKEQQQIDAMLRKELDAFLAALPEDVAHGDTAFVEGLVWDALRAQVRNLKADLLVVGTHGRTGVSRALLGSVAQDLLSEPPCDVLAVKAW